MRIFYLIIISLIFTSCASWQLLDEYTAVSDTFRVKSEGKTFLVNDNVEKSKALVREGELTDIAKSYVEGATLTLVDLTPAASKFEAGLIVYFEEYKDSKCEITRSNFISDGVGVSGGMGYEIFYKCEGIY